MSCRLIKGAGAVEAQALSWNEKGQTLPADSATRSGPPAKLYADPASQVELPSNAASREVEQRLAEAYQRGLREGETGATQRMAQQVSAKIDQLSRSIEQLALHRGKIQREAEPELVRLSLAIARRILRRELSVDPESLLGLVKAGLDKVESSEVHRVRVHPEHASILAGLLEGAARRVEIASDPGLPVGAVIFETTRGSLDVGLETQLKEIERGFADIYPQ
jgi:flagellar assembly protein FliH